MEEQEYILIERYLQGATSPEETTAVEQRSASDTVFAAAIEGRRQLNDHLRAVANEDKLLPTLESLGEQYFPEREAMVRPLGNNRRWLFGLVAAAVIALAVFFAGPWFSPSGGGYEQFAQHEPLSITERGNGQQAAVAAEAAYNDGRFSEAIELIKAYLKDQNDDERARLALGVSLLETDRDEEAIVIFQQIADGRTALAAYGNWYLALAAVKRGDEAEARRYLGLIPSTDTFLTAKAKELRATL